MSQKSSLALSTDVYNHLRTAYQLPILGLKECRFKLQTKQLVYFESKDDEDNAHVCLLRYVITGEVVKPNDFIDFLRQLIFVPNCSAMTIVVQMKSLVVIDYTMFADKVGV